MKDSETIIYSLLSDVFSAEAYSGIALNDGLKSAANESKAYITKVFYGVIEKSVQFDYIIAKLCDKKPKKSVAILLKIGLYMLRYTDTPTHAAINKTVSLAKSVGKSGVAGFVNATLRKSVDVDLAGETFSSDSEALSVRFSYPEWIVKKLIKQYGSEQASAFLSYQKREKTHIRCNLNRLSEREFRDKLSLAAGGKAGVEESGLGAYVTHEVMRRLASDCFTAQSYASMLAVHSYVSAKEIERLKIKRVLDVCAAPGGKSVYLKQLFPELEITACDIHPHRLKLVEDYARRMNAELKTALNDGTRLKEEWINKFDLVICDVPCSGLGLVNSKPDIMLNRSAGDIESLRQLQAKILSNSANYVKKGGILCYSTCTVLREENGDVVDSFLKKNNAFQPVNIELKQGKTCEHGHNNEQEKYLQLLPHIHDCDGFFIAKLQRVEDDSN